MKTDRVRLFLPISACLTALLLLLKPDVAVQGARDGLNCFYSLILPALLPFFICADMIRQSGLLQAAGKALGRPMQVLFRLSGECGAVYLIGAVSGYPAGARLAGQLYFSGRLSLDEMERLCLLSNLCGPLFVSGAISVGILGDMRLAVPMLVAHHLGAWLITITYARFFPGNSDRFSISAQKTCIKREPERLPFGTILGNSTYDAMLSMLKICGITVLFTVLIRLTQSTGAMQLLSGLFAKILSAFMVPASMGESLAIGLFDMTTACQAAARTQATQLVQSAFCTALFTFGGLSIIMQTLAFAPIKASRFIPAKILHSVLSALLATALIPLFIDDSRAVIAIQKTNPAWYTDILAVLGLLSITALTIGVIALASKMLSKKS